MNWRWLVPIAMTAAAVIVSILSRDPRAWLPAGASLLWLWLMLVASPTIFYYRLLILIGERLFPPRPVASALALLLAGAVLPPLLHNIIADRSSQARNFVDPAPPGIETIAIDRGDFGHPDLVLEKGFARCDDDCMRLLLGGGAARVVVGNSSDPRDFEPRFMRGVHEQPNFPTAQVLHVEARPTCPPVATRRDDPNNIAFPGGPLLEPTDIRPRMLSVEDRAIALIAAGHCLLAEPGAFRQAGLRLGSRLSVPREGPSIAPDGFGLIGAEYRFVDRREGSNWRRVSQRITRGAITHWTYPFAFLPWRFSWFAATPIVADRPETQSDRAQPWRWAGITLPTLPDPGEARVRELLAAAVALPADAPRDARHQLAWQYLRGLSWRRADDVDRALLLRIIADPRVRATDLQPLEELLRGNDAATLGRALVERIRRTEPRRGEIRFLAFLVTRLPPSAWPALLPSLRGLAADPLRAGEAQPAFGLFGAGDADDAVLLIDLFRSVWPVQPLGMQPSEAEQRAQVTTNERVQAYLIGLCALAGKSGAIRPALIAASREDPVRPGDGPIILIWRIMAAMGVPIERLAAEQNRSAQQRDEIARSASLSPGVRCPPDPRGSGLPLF